MKKAYIQPEAELLSLTLLEDFLTGSSDDEDVKVNGGANNDEWPENGDANGFESTDGGKWD